MAGLEDLNAGPERPGLPAYSAPNRPPASAVGVEPEPAPRLDRGLFGLAVLCIMTSAALDNLRGPLLPLWVERLDLSHTVSATFVACVGFGALLMMAASAPLLTAWPQRRFLALAAGLHLAAAFAVAAAGGALTLLGAGVVWGAGNAGIGLSANLYAIAASPAHLRARVMSALHVGYGVCAALPALYLPWAAARFPLAAALVAPFALLAVPLAAAYARPREVRSREESSARGAEPFTAEAWLLVAGLSLYAVGEVLIVNWMVTHCVARGMELPAAGRVMAGFFAALAAGRLGVVLFLPRSLERRLPAAAMLAACVLFAYGLGGRPLALAACGFAVAPVFPLLAALFPADYPKRYKKLLGIAYSVMMTLVLAGHQTFGWLSDAFGVAFAYRMPLFCFAAAAACLAARESLRVTARSTSR